MQFDGFWFNTWSPRTSIVSQRVEDFFFELDEDNVDYVEFIENTAKIKPVSTFRKAPKLFAKEFLQLLTRAGTWFNFCWVCAADLSKPLPHYSPFCGQL